MVLEKKLTAAQIVNEVGMSNHPEFYSGRGAILTDLNSEILEKVYESIEKEYGRKASNNFIKMVANMQDLAASNFLTCLYSLERMEWNYSGFQSDLPGGIAVAKDKDGNYDMDSGVIGLISALCFRGRDETEAIRGPFLRKHGLTDSKRRFIEDPYGKYYFPGEY